MPAGFRERGSGGGPPASARGLIRAAAVGTVAAGAVSLLAQDPFLANSAGVPVIAGVFGGLVLVIAAELISWHAFVSESGRLFSTLSECYFVGGTVAGMWPIVRLFEPASVLQAALVLALLVFIPRAIWLTFSLARRLPRSDVRWASAASAVGAGIIAAAILLGPPPVAAAEVAMTLYAAVGAGPIALALALERRTRWSTKTRRF